MHEDKKRKEKTMKRKIIMENPGIDPGTSRMLSERSPIWANSPPRLEMWLNKFKIPLHISFTYTKIVSHNISTY